MATDVYKLEWTRSRTTIQAGVASIMQKDAFMDTIVVCNDGAVTHNKLTLGLVLPDLHQVSVFDLPVEHTILMPDHSVFEVQVGNININSKWPKQNVFSPRVLSVPSSHTPLS